MESKGKNVDVSLNVSGTPPCDEASSSGYSDLPKRSEGQDFDVNLKIPGAPRCDEAPSSSSSSGPPKSRSDLNRSKLISSKRKVDDVNLDDLWKHISELQKLREEGNHKQARSLDHFTWPDVPALKKLKEIVSFGTNLPINEIHGAVQAILKEIGRVNVATAAPLVVAYILERYDFYTPREKFWHLVKEMHYLAIVLKGLSENPERMPDVMQEATSLIIEAVLLFSAQFDCSRSASEVHAIRGKLNTMYMHIKVTVRVFTPEKYPTHADNGQVEEDLLSTRRPKEFKMEALVAATNNFHERNKLGGGGFGAVYKGTTHDGKQIAVKKMFTSDERSPEILKKQFENEKLLAEVQHRNVVNLLGSCEQESQWFLVYEYLPNKSLDQFLFDPQNRKRLDWHKRYNIILGIARALLYLHQDSRVRIVHRDIKASNILLDDELNPQIADFGTANILPENKTHVTATSAAGTFGYMPPEYFMTKKFSVRTDVYSFGILLLEILTGKKISSDALKFLGWVWSLYNRKKALQTIDPIIIETSDKEATKALRCIQVGLLCTQGDFWLRPKMSEVIAMLSTYESLPDPKNPPCLPSYCATQENGNSAREKLMSFMRAVFPSRIGKIDAQAIT